MTLKRLLGCMGKKEHKVVFYMRKNLKRGLNASSTGTLKTDGTSVLSTIWKKTRTLDRPLSETTQKSSRLWPHQVSRSSTLSMRFSFSWRICLPKALMKSISQLLWTCFCVTSLNLKRVISITPHSMNL